MRRCNRASAYKDGTGYGRGIPLVGEISVEDLHRGLAIGRQPDSAEVCDAAMVEVTDIIHVLRIARPVRLAWREREPSGGSPFFGAQSDTAGAEKCNDCRLIHRVFDKGARKPSPVLVDQCPAPGMRRRKAPGLVVDPGPAPGCDPAPMPKAVGRPFWGDAREPNRAVLRVYLPVAGGVEITG